MLEKKDLDCGLISTKAQTVIISAVLETVGQMRFGDGTEVNLTVNEKDLIPTLSGGFVEKVVFSGSKRRGVDRRTIHALRNRMLRKIEKGEDKGPLYDCFIPGLCSECPICWLYGSVGAVGEAAKKKNYNIKSRLLYASALSVEPSDISIAIHSRNAPDEQDHTTGEAGIHSEELIKANVHFPTITVLDRVLDWEIGAFAHALLENVNENRYSAASARQGGIRFCEGKIGKLIVVDVSGKGIFPLESIKVPGEETEFKKVMDLFEEAHNLEKVKTALESQGFHVDSPNADRLTVKDKDKELWVIEKEKNTRCVLTIKQREEVLMTRYIGDKAFGFLREQQENFRSFLANFDEQRWKNVFSEIKRKFNLEDKKIKKRATKK